MTGRRSLVALPLVAALAAGCAGGSQTPPPVTVGEAQDLVRQILADGDRRAAGWCDQWAADVPLCRRHMRVYGDQPPNPGRIVAVRREGRAVVVTVGHARTRTDLQVIRDESEVIRVIDPVHWSGARFTGPPGPTATVSP